MFKQFPFLLIMVLGFCLAGGGAASGADAKKMTEDKKIADANTRNIADLQKAAQQAGTALQQARNKVVNFVAPDAGLAKAQGAVTTNAALVDRLTKELTKATKERPEYLKAVTTADVARQKLGEVREDKSLSEATRKRLTDGLNQDLWAPTELVNRALDRNAALEAARNQLEQAKIDLAALQKEIGNAIQGDPDVQEATRKSQEAVARLGQAKKDWEAWQRAAKGGK
jgi:hypothetical protein